jgi:signal transduction histidine kinase
MPPAAYPGQTVGVTTVPDAPAPRVLAWIEGCGVVVWAAALAVVMLPLTVIALVQLPDPPLPGAAIGWILALCTLLHAASFVARGIPVVAFGIGSAAMLGLALTTVAGSSTAGLMPSAAAYLLLVWQVAATQPRRLSRAALAVGLVGAAVMTAVDALSQRAGDPFAIAGEFVALGGVITAAWALGALARQRRAAADLAATERVRRAIADERARIGRDLHDVVSHGLTVMIAQAEAARTLVDEPRAGEAIDRVAETGRTAMRGLRGMLRVLGEETAAPLAPAPSLEALGELVSAASSPERRTDLVQRGTPRPLAPDAELALYRAVQEALTNALRHVRPPMSVTVELDWGADTVVAVVADDGGAGHLDASPGGTGLLGMAERVGRAGGSIEVDRGRAWRVRVELPVEAGG